MAKKKKTKRPMRHRPLPIIDENASLQDDFLSIPSAATTQGRNVDTSATSFKAKVIFILEIAF
jgi:hypothetical protein